MRLPDQSDATLYTQLLAITQTDVHAAARHWVLFECSAESYADLGALPAGDTAKLMNVLSFFDSVGVLISRGLLHEDIFYDAPFSFAQIWPRLRPIVEQWRGAAGDETLWENVHWLGLRYDHWRDVRWARKIDARPVDRSPVPS